MIYHLSLSLTSWFVNPKRVVLWSSLVVQVRFIIDPVKSILKAVSVNKFHVRPILKSSSILWSLDLCFTKTELLEQEFFIIHFLRSRLRFEIILKKEISIKLLEPACVA